MSSSADSNSSIEANQNPEDSEVQDSLAYVDLVKTTFESTPEVYNDFIKISKDFKLNRLETFGVMQKVCILFQDHPDLIEGFNSFLSDEWKIKRKNQSSDNSEENEPKYQLRIPSDVFEIYETLLRNSVFEVVPQATDNQQTSENEQEQNNQQQ